MRGRIEPNKLLARGYWLLGDDVCEYPATSVPAAIPLEEGRAHQGRCGSGPNSGNICRWSLVWNSQVAHEDPLRRWESKKAKRCGETEIRPLPCVVNTMSSGCKLGLITTFCNTGGQNGGTSWRSNAWKICRASGLASGTSRWKSCKRERSSPSQLRCLYPENKKPRKRSYDDRLPELADAIVHDVRRFRGTGIQDVDHGPVVA